MKWVQRLFFATLVIVVVWTGWRFATVNSAPIDIHYIFGQWQGLPLWRALVSAAAIGGLCVGLGMGFLLIRSSLIARRYRRLCAGLEEEVHQLRNLPLVDSSDSPDGRKAPETERAATRKLAAGGG